VAYRISVKERNRAQMTAYLAGKGCADCGETDPVVLEFDHRGDKAGNIADMVSCLTAWGTILKELEKCQIRCANCHRRKTARQFGWYRARSSEAA
jgi:hypothetical protein